MSLLLVVLLETNMLLSCNLKDNSFVSFASYYNLPEYCSSGC